MLFVCMYIVCGKMGFSFGKLFSRFFVKKEMRILMVGFDVVGKIIILYKFKLGEIVIIIFIIGTVFKYLLIEIYIYT